MASETTKICFVTIGATAPFNGLIRAVLRNEFLLALVKAKYTELRIQYGSSDGEAIYQQRKAELNDKFAVRISGFSFKPEGLRDEMIAIKSGPSQGHYEGVVISHAGSGSVLDVLRLGVPLVVVPNTDLLHNHQLELAEELASQHYVVHGKLENLASSIAEAEMLRTKMNQWPPVTRRQTKRNGGLASVIAEEMGWVD